MKTEMILNISGGQATCLHSDLIPLQSLGTMTVRRASTVEFNEKTQEWEVIPNHRYFSVFSSPSREACLAWERRNYESFT